MKASPVFGPQGRVSELARHDGPTFVCRVRIDNARLLVCGSLAAVMIWVRLALECAGAGK